MVKGVLRMDKIERIPLDISTKDLDREEGGLINSMKSTHISPFPEPVIDGVIGGARCLCPRDIFDKEEARSN